MTFHEFAIQYLQNKGVTFEKHLAGIMAVCKEYQPDMAYRWHEDIDGYPPLIRVALTESLNHAALDWIDANLPRARFRPMFLPEEERPELFRSVERPGGK